MRHLVKLNHGTLEGDQRLRVGFLFFPKTINGEKRWLEYTSWMQKYTHHYQAGSKWDNFVWCLPSDSQAHGGPTIIKLS